MSDNYSMLLGDSYDEDDELRESFHTNIINLNDFEHYHDDVKDHKKS